MIDRSLAHPRILVSSALVCAGALLLTACSSAVSGQNANGSGTPSASSSAAASQQARNGGGFPRAAATGEIAAISGKTLQVQSTSEQTAVTYSASTRFSITKSTSLSAVRVGSCVFATSAATGTAAAAGATRTSITATDVRVSAAKNGSCVGDGLGAGRGGFPNGTRPSGARPSGARTGTRRSGAPTGTRLSGAAGGFGGFAALTGKVTAVSGSTITVSAIERRANTSASATPTTTKPTKPTKPTIKVTPSTKYTTTAATTSKAAKVGLCATVQGKTDTRGAVSATAIALSNKTNGSCTTGFGGQRAGAPGAGNGAGARPGGAAPSGGVGAAPSFAAGRTTNG